MEKHIVKTGNELKTVQYAELHKYNQDAPPTGICSFCLEDSIFRVVKINKVNQLACTRCLASARLYKTVPLRDNRMFKKGRITLEDKLCRIFFRVWRYFTGDLVHHPFKIKKRSKLGAWITKKMILIKGVQNA